MIKLKANKKKYNEKTINKLRRSICDGIICGKDSKIKFIKYNKMGALLIMLFLCKEIIKIENIEEKKYWVWITLINGQPLKTK